MRLVRRRANASRSFGYRRGTILAAQANAASILIVCVLVGFEAIRWYWLDPAVSLLISAVIGVQGWQLLRSTADVLLESTPAGLDVDSLSSTMAAVDGVESVHDLHVWTLSSDVRALSAHVVLDGHPSLEEAQVVGARVKSTIGGRFRISHATLELECEACGVPDDFCTIDTTRSRP